MFNNCLHRSKEALSLSLMFLRMGYTDDQRGIIRRYQREKQNWSQHLQNSQQFAIAAMQCKARGTAVKKKIRSLNSVHCCVCDISGFAHPVYHYVKKHRNSRNRPPVSVLQPQNTPDVRDFSKSVQQHHIAMLPHNRSCLVAEQNDAF
jgi:hypothetical protein